MEGDALREEGRVSAEEESVVRGGSMIEPDWPKPRLFGRQLTNGANSLSNGVLRAEDQPSERDEAHRHTGALTLEPVAMAESPKATSPYSSAVSLTLSPAVENQSRRMSNESIGSSRPASVRSTSAPRPRRRSSQQRVSLIAGRLSMVSIEPPSPPPDTAPRLLRYGSQSSFTSVASAAPPTPSSERDTFLGGRSISEFVIEGELGRGAYGLVKRAREMDEVGELGVSVHVVHAISKPH